MLKMLSPMRKAAVVISGDTCSSISIGTTTGAITVHLAEAEPITRSSNEETTSSTTSMIGTGRCSSLSL